MKQVWILLVILTATVYQLSYAQTIGTSTEQQVSTKILFNKTEHNFGTQPQGIPVSCEFAFTNTGITPLQLQSVRPSCGCTTPIWTNDTVLPGQKGVINVSYNMVRAGSFNKPITVTTVAGEIIMLYIKGEAISTENVNSVDEVKPSLVTPE